MAQCFALYAAQHSGMAQGDSDALDAFLARTATLVQKLHINFDINGGEALRLFMQQEFIGSDWITLCLRRSHV